MEGGREDRERDGRRKRRQEEQTYNFENHLQRTCSCMS